MAITTTDETLVRYAGAVPLHLLAGLLATASSPARLHFLQLLCGPGLVVLRVGLLSTLGAASPNPEVGLAAFIIATS